MEGYVKFYNSERGWGFIQGQDGEAYFVHHTDIDAQGFRKLNQDDDVEFEPIDSPKGPKAVKVVKKNQQERNEPHDTNI